MNKTTICVSLLLFTPSAFACSQLPATAAFIVLNDKNDDRALNSEEWLHAQSHENLIFDFQLNQISDFAAFDRDKNGKIEAREIGFDSVHYLHNPCAEHPSTYFQQIRLPQFQQITI